MAIVEVLIRTIDQSKGDVNKLTGDLGKLAMKYVSVGAVAVATYKVISDSIKTTLDYADAVRKLSELSGTSTESSSRFIQVLDDYKISAEDALLATKALTKEGHTPSIETLAKLSDEYLSLNSKEAQNAFILKNLGKGGLEWVEVLSKGSKALLEQGAAVDQALILSQKQVDAARRNEIAVDNWNDSIQGVKISIGNELLPVMTSFTDALNININAQKIMADSGKKGAIGSVAWAKAINQATEEQKASTDAMMKNADAMDKNGKSAEQLKEEEDALKEVAKELSTTFTEQLSLIGQMQSESESFSKSQQTLADKEDDLNQKIAEATLEYGAQSEQVQSLQQDYQNIQDQYKANADAHEQAENRILLGLYQQKFAADGIITDAEFTWLLEKGEAWGVYSADVVKDAQAAWQEADKVANSINDIPDNKDITITTHHYDDYGSDYTPPGGNLHAHASGGSFVIPSSYGREGFRMGARDTASAGETVTVTPAGQQAPGASIDYKKMARAMRDALVQSGMAG